MKAVIYSAAIAAVALTSVVAFAQKKHAGEEKQKPARDERIVAMPAANWLFVQTADSMTFKGTTLTLKGIAPQTLMFTDRPERMTGDAPTAKFVSFWTSGKSDFEKDPPNATLSVTAGGEAHLSVVELTNPQLEGDVLTYTVKLLGDPPPPASGEAASLFIDWWYGPGWGPRRFWGPGPWGGWGGGYCWRGPWGGLHCRPAWAW
jgi:hypothetical protein